MRDYYEPKFLRGLIEQTLPPRLFFRTRFFNDVVKFPTTKVSFEFMENKNRMIPYARPDGGSVSLDRDGYQLETYTPPLVSGSRMITPETLDMKLPGEAEWNSGYDPTERAERLAARDLMDLQNAIVRKEEYMCARVKQDGYLQVSKGKKVEYGFTNIEEADASGKWTDSYDIVTKLYDKVRELRKRGVNPDMVILGAGAGHALMTNKGFTKLVNNLNNLIFVRDTTSQELEQGLSYLCHLTVPGLSLDFYEYTDIFYDDASGESKPYVDDDAVIIQSSKERNMMLYGAVTVIDESGQYMSESGQYVPSLDIQRDPPGRKLILSSRPLPMPVDVNAWYVLRGVV